MRRIKRNEQRRQRNKVIEDVRIKKKEKHQMRIKYVVSLKMISDVAQAYVNNRL